VYLEAGRNTDAERSLRQADNLGLPRKSARDFSRELWKLLNTRKMLTRPAASAMTPLSAETEQ